MTRLIIVKINDVEYVVNSKQLEKLTKSKHKVEVIGGYDTDENDYNSIAIKEHD